MPGDPHIPPAPERPYLDEVANEPGRLRIGLGTTSLTGETAHQDCVKAAESTARLLEELGHEVELRSPQVDSGQLFKSFGGVMTGYLGWSIAKWAAQTGREPAESEFEAVTWRMYQHSKRQGSADYLLAWQQLQECCRQFAEFFIDCDAWLTPTLARPPQPLGYFGYDPDNKMEHIEHLGHYTGFTLIANASGHPAISLPLHWNGDGLPVGVQLTGRFGEEATLLNLAGQLERARPWLDRRPPLD